ncbi:hypothetical protein ACLBWS_02165, partial [Brucellaceae bacterium D45D]
APDGGERHFCLESRAMVPARSSRHGISCSRHLSRNQAEIPLILAVQISRATSRFDDLDKKIEKVSGILSKIMWLVISGLIMAFVAFVIGGGLKPM